MKRQWLITHSGFTIFELMIVITILAFFYMVTWGFNLSPQTDMQKADRMVVWVSSSLRTEIQNVLIGKMPNRDGKIAALTKIQISTWGLIALYLTGADATPIWRTSFVTPFFEGDNKYEISEVAWTWSDTPSQTYTGYADLIVDPTGISFSWANNSNIYLEITVAYNTRSRKVTLDRRTGKISETKN